MYSANTRFSNWSVKCRVALVTGLAIVSVLISNVPFLEIVGALGFISAGFLFVWLGERQKIQHAVIAAAGAVGLVVSALLAAPLAVLVVVDWLNGSDVEYSVYGMAPVGGAQVPLPPGLLAVTLLVAVSVFGAFGGLLASLVRGEEFGR